MAKHSEPKKAPIQVEQPTDEVPSQETETQDKKQPKASQTNIVPWAELLNVDAKKFTDDKIASIVENQIKYDLANSGLVDKYNFLFLVDRRGISRLDADRIYKAATNADGNKPTLLIISSPGGSVSAAYFIAKLCREYTNKTFEVAVPRQAKSAATLICCGADKIHMGSLSELGPIDPQFGNLPALALKYSVEHIAQLVKAYPDATEMFSKYLTNSLRVESLGYHERVAESTTHYASRLLDSRAVSASNGLSNAQIAKRLVYEYRDHGFVIDAREATDIFGDSFIGRNTKEYEAANRVYETLDLLVFVFESRFNKTFAFVGDIATGTWLMDNSNNNPSA